MNLQVILLILYFCEVKNVKLRSKDRTKCPVMMFIRKGKQKNTKCSLQSARPIFRTSRSAAQRATAWSATRRQAVVHLIYLIGWCVDKCLPGSKSQSTCKSGKENCLFDNWIFAGKLCVFARHKFENYHTAEILPLKPTTMDDFKALFD